jgi:glycosyltransferase involved in cell wall biosynthesis
MARVWQGLAEVFAARGHDAHIFARAYPGQPVTEQINGVTYHRWGGYSQSTLVWRDLLQNLPYSTLLARQLPEADILVTNDFWLPALAGRLRPKAGRIVISANRFPKRQYWMYGRAARIAAASRPIQRAIAEQTPGLSGRIRVFPNPIDLSVFRPKAERTQCGPFRLLFVGRLHPEKGVHLLVEAFGRLAPRHPEWRLQLVGPTAPHQGGGGPEYATRLQNLAQKAPVEFIGPVFDLVHLSELYREADLFCYPSLAEKGEAMPVAPLEAMASGIVPVVSNIECFRDFIIPEENGFVFDHRAPDPVQALTVTIDKLVSQVSLFRTAGDRAAKVAAGFGFTSIGARFLDDFASLILGRKSERDGQD